MAINRIQSSRLLPAKKTLVTHRWLCVLASTALALVSNAIQADCGGLVLHAHRGEPTQPENSISAISKAFKGAWDGVEIDLQQLRDREWVINHDPVLGRTTSLSRRTAAELDSANWREVKLKDRKGRVTSEPAPFLVDMLQTVSDINDKVINAEIKQPYLSCDAAQQAVATMQEGRPSGQWFLTSIDRRHLRCARSFDSTGYLGVIVLDPQSLARQNQRTAAAASRLKPPNIDEAWLTLLKSEITPPVGIHVDINTLKANPKLLADASAQNVSVFTYHLAGVDREHAEALQRSAQVSGFWPTGAVIDSSASAFCEKLSISRTKKTATSD